MTNTIIIKKSIHDKFYTKRSVIQSLLQHIPHSDKYIEPSAGDGRWLDYLPNTIGFDIAPDSIRVIKADFLQLDTSTFSESVVIGNPPFGTSCNLAVQFFNKCSEFASHICFIVPKTFRKQSIHNRLNLHFHLDTDIDLPKNSFELNGSDYDVPCCFQVWSRKSTPRKQIKITTSPLLDFCDQSEANIAIRRVGGKAGTVLAGLSHSKSSTYFINIKSQQLLESLLENNIQQPDNVNNTAGIRSISKGELIELIENHYTEMQQ